MPRTRLEREQATRRRARHTGALGFAGAVALPLWLWHGVIADIARAFRPEVRYLVAGWSPWLLMAAGLLCLAWAGIVDWRARDRRFHTTGSGAWVGWGVTLYILGFGLATQVAQIAQSQHRL
jgi:hypothetical protein